MFKIAYVYFTDMSSHIIQCFSTTFVYDMLRESRPILNAAVSHIASATITLTSVAWPPVHIRKLCKLCRHEAPAIQLC